ncbi:MAG TPA: hypothetical protein VFA07_15355 [Chthonomonadaceae bacterium]|nr:hypothetical protein [Chthonomonadaceae bacterium]
MGLQRKIRRVPAIFAASALGATLLAGGAPLARAVGGQTGQESHAHLNSRVDMEMADTPLPIAIKLIEQHSGINIVFLHPDSPYGTVTLSVKDKPVSEVLHLIAQSAGADLWEEDGIYYIGPKGSAPKPQPAPVPVTSRGADLPSAPVRWEKIKLMYVAPHTMLRYLGLDGGPIADLEDQMTVRAMNTLLNSSGRLQQPIQSNYQIAPWTGGGPVAAPSVPTEPVPNGTSVPSVGGSQSGTNTNGSAPLQITPSNSPDQGANRGGGDDQEFGRGGQGMGIGGRGGFGGGQGGFGGGQGGFGGQGGGGLGGQGGGQGSASGLLPPGMTTQDIFAYDADNSIIIRYTDPAVLQQLRALIRLFDVKPRQIMVRAEFVAVSQNDVNAIGINWSFQKVNLVGGTSLGGLTPTTATAFIQYAAGNLQTQLSWVLTTGHGKLVDSAMATTLNNVPVTFNTTINEAAFVSTPVVAGTGTVILASQIFPIPVTTGIAILPRINGDDSITVFGVALNSDLGGTITGPNGASFPITIVQTAPIQRIIRNGDTIVIAGSVRKNDVVSTAKVPLLGDLPLIGQFFRSHNISTNDSELLVFVTPTIIPERPSLAAPSGGVGPGGLAPGGAGPGETGGGVIP